MSSLISSVDKRSSSRIEIEFLAYHLKLAFSKSKNKLIKIKSQSFKNIIFANIKKREMVQKPSLKQTIPTAVGKAEISIVALFRREEIEKDFSCTVRRSICKHGFGAVFIRVDPENVVSLDWKMFNFFVDVDFKSLFWYSEGPSEFIPFRYITSYSIFCTSLLQPKKQHSP